MTEAISDNVILSYIEEDTFGTKKSGSNLQLLRHTGETLKTNLGVVQSAEITGDRQLAGVKKTSQSVGGDINYELSYGTQFEDFFRAALMYGAAWKAEETNIVAQVTIDASDVDNSFNDSGNGLAAFDTGEWVYVAGFTETANNGFFRLESVAAAKIIVSGGTLVTEAAGDSVTITQLASITNGSTDVSFNIEREYDDIGSDYMLFLGMMLEGFTMSVVPEQIITGAFNTIGKTYEALTASAGSGYDAKSTTDWLNAVDDVLGLLENQSAITLAQLDLAVANNLRQRLVLGSLGPQSMGAGQFNVSGSIQVYYESKTLFTKFLNQTETQLAFKLQDTAGNTYIIDLPAVKFSDGTRNAGAKESDIMANLNFLAYKDSSLGHTMKICKKDA